MYICYDCDEEFEVVGNCPECGSGSVGPIDEFDDEDFEDDDFDDDWDDEE